MIAERLTDLHIYFTYICETHLEEGLTYRKCSTHVCERNRKGRKRGRVINE